MPMLIDAPKRVNIVRLRCVRLGPQRLSIAIGQGRLCPRSHYSLFTAQGCTRRAQRSRPTITDHYSRVFQCGGVGRGYGVGRDLGVALGVPVGVGVAVGVPVGVGLTVAVGVAVGDGVGVGPA